MKTMMRKMVSLAISCMLLWAVAVPSFASNIPDDTDLTEEEIMDLIRTGEGYYLGEGAPLDEFQTTRWASGMDATHQYITSWGQVTLYNSYPAVYTWYLDQSGAFSTIVEYSDWPDNHETISPSGILRHHFYYVDEGESGNYHAGKYFENHYNDAVNYYKSGNPTEAFRSLGKAMHYLEDASTPVHTSSTMYGMVSPISHSSYESTVNSNLERFNHTAATIYSSYATARLSSIVPDAATYAYSKLPSEPFTESSILLSADGAVPRAMRNAGAIYYRFYLDVT